jgi:hypothetical protein
MHKYGVPQNLELQSELMDATRLLGKRFYSTLKLIIGVLDQYRDALWYW